KRPCAFSCHPDALGRPLTHEAGLGALSTDRYVLLPWHGNVLRQARFCLSQETYLPLLFVHIDATICHGWSPLCGMDRVRACGAEATTRGGPAAALHLYSWEV